MSDTNRILASCKVKLYANDLLIAEIDDAALFNLVLGQILLIEQSRKQNDDGATP